MAASIPLFPFCLTFWPGVWVTVSSRYVFLPDSGQIVLVPPLFQCKPGFLMGSSGPPPQHPHPALSVPATLTTSWSPNHQASWTQSFQMWLPLPLQAPCLTASPMQPAGLIEKGLPACGSPSFSPCSTITSNYEIIHESACAHLTPRLGAKLHKGRATSAPLAKSPACAWVGVPTLPARSPAPQSLPLVSIGSPSVPSPAGQPWPA